MRKELIRNEALFADFASAVMQVLSFTQLVTLLISQLVTLLIAQLLLYLYLLLNLW